MECDNPEYFKVRTGSEVIVCLIYVSSCIRGVVEVLVLVLGYACELLCIPLTHVLIPPTCVTSLLTPVCILIRVMDCRNW